ncbi:MAG: DNA-formamidopyrimidine glycosylase [Patescibacteria group bacterium]|jgi:formamidopyrimidine-DNA glycosylase
MPELPEIETIKNGLSRFILNKEIKGFLIKDKKLRFSLKNLEKIKKDSFSDVNRIGKMLVFSFAKNSSKLLIHLKMTGQLIFCPGRDKKVLLAGGHSDKVSAGLNCENLKYIRFAVVFKNKDKLFLNDARRFAYVKLVKLEEFLKIEKKFGLEPVNAVFLLSDFIKLIQKRPRKNIKAFLLDQSLVAGIGNIYADEILFSSNVNPLRKVESLTAEEIKSIFSNIKRILKLAVKKKGTTFSDYVDLEGNSGGFLKLLKVYGREKEKCFKCGEKIRKIRVAGRGTHYCPKCQKN